VLMVGTRSADYIRASGHSGRILKAAYMAAPDPLVEMSEFPLAPRPPSIHGTSATIASLAKWVAIGGRADNKARWSKS
jgi:hypothetical protein